MSTTIYKQEDAIFESIKKSMTPTEREEFIADGLCWAAISHNDYEGMETLYMQQRPRIVVLLKDPYGVDCDDDYRDWDWSEVKGAVSLCTARWIKGLLTTTVNNCPSISDFEDEREIFKEIPLAIVNVKKTIGQSKVDWDTLYDYAERFAKQLREQIDLYKPDIVICGGSTDSTKEKDRMLYIARMYLYPECEFKKENKYCHYCKDNHLLLIDSYHPSARGVSDEWKFDKMFYYYQEFISKQPNWIKQ